MKIFSNTPIKETPASAPAKKGTQKAAAARPSISDKEIRNKLAASTAISDTAKTKAKEAAVKLGEGYMKSDINPKDHVLKSDVQANDPTDPVTSEKLKSILDRGAFSFNPKEREVLSKILSE